LTNKEIRKSLKASALDGAGYASMAGLTQNYITPYALQMNATNTQIGFLSGIPSFAQVLTQLVSPMLAEKIGSRKIFILTAATLHGLMWLPILLIPYLFPNFQIWYLIAFISLCTAFDALGNAPWNSMMADLVPVEVRGRYFSQRNKIINFVMMIMSLVAGGVLQLLTKNGFLGFTIILAGAMISRFFSVYSLTQMVYPAQVKPKVKQSSIFQLSGTLFTTNIGKFIVFNSLINLAANFSAPYFSVYLLRDVKVSYLFYVVINTIPILSTLLFMPFWGKRIDKAGSIKVLKISSVFVPLLPLLWLISANFFFLCGVQMLSGFAWAGVNLSINLFLYYAAPLENRTRYIALSNAMMFGGAAVGSLLGGIAVTHVPAFNLNQIFTIFLISGIARIVVLIIYVPQIKEVRHVPQMSVRQVLFGGTQFAHVNHPIKKSAENPKNQDKK
jgi:MFS family permease